MSERKSILSWKHGEDDCHLIVLPEGPHIAIGDTFYGIPSRFGYESGFTAAIAELERLQSIVDQDIGGALDRAERAVLNRGAGYESGLTASRERVAALEYFLRIYITAHQHGDSVPSLLEAEALETLGNAATLAALGEEAKDGE